MPQKNRFIGIVLTIALSLASLSTAAMSVQVGADPQIEVVKLFDASLGQLPEGITVDKEGNLYVSLMPIGQLWKLKPDGSEPVLLLDLGVEGVFGLAVDPPGNVYMTHYSGVYRVTKDGQEEKLPGTEEIGWANALAFDKRGNLYVTDSALGAIWRIPIGGSAELWLQDELLFGLDTIPPFSPVGANGIAYRHGSLFVANTEKGLIVRVPILKGGVAGDPLIIAEGPELYGLDGIALDVHGDIYALLVLQNKLVRIDSETGEVAEILSDEALNMPASLSFGTGKGGRQSIYITNFSLLDPEIGIGPAILKVDVGVPGLPLP